MPLPLLDLLKYIVIGLMWLLFLRVIRAVWVEVRSTQPARTPRTRDRHREDAEMLVGAEQPRMHLAGEGPSSPPSSAKPNYRLLVVSGPLTGAEFGVEREMLIGRSEDCAVSIAKDTFASSRHARMVANGDDLWIEDLRSTNGTKVNGNGIEAPQRLEVGDSIEIGKSTFMVAK
ncbi:MAG: FHA domain-containing protein [Acidimicrobiales bacterium]